MASSMPVTVGWRLLASKPMEMPLFDIRALFSAIEAERLHRGLSWNSLALQVGVAASTVRRLSQADDAEADGVLALVRWLGSAPEDFVPGGSVKGKRLRRAGEGYVRVDMELVAAASGDHRGANGRTRTSIQRLVEVAQRSGLPIEALTRFSEV